MKEKVQTMVHFESELIEHLEVSAGTTISLESLRQAHPPYFTPIPFIELPSALTLLSQQRLDEDDGENSCVFTLKAAKPFSGRMAIGYRDMQTQYITHRKEISVVIW